MDYFGFIILFILVADPVPHKPWTGVRQATEYGPVCPQFFKISNSYIPGSEDCLFLNVFTLNLEPEELLPVLFFIHGGQFSFGSGKMYGPEILLCYGLVLVTINYRLDSLGFLNLGTKEVPGNAGMKDQRLALKWAYDNIEQFGGDPNMITIMGESSGSASVIYHMLSPMSKGLFKRAASMSGVPFCEWATIYQQINRSFKLGQDLGNNTTDPTTMLNFLQSVPVKSLIHQFPILIPKERDYNFGFKMTPFLPCPEGEYGQVPFMVETPIETLKRGNITPVDLLIGYTSMEGLVLVPPMLTTDIINNYNDKRELLIPREILFYGSVSNDTASLSDRIHEHYFGDGPIDITTIRRLVQYISEEVFVYSVNRFLKHLPNSFRKYLYKFSIVSSRNRYTAFGVPFGIEGVAHTDDLVYLFEMADPTVIDITGEVYRLINQTVTLFTNFLKYGNPTPDNLFGIIWPEYNNETKGYVNIDETLTTGNNPDADANAFWTSLHEQSGIELP